MVRKRSWSPWPVRRLAILVAVAAVLAAGALFGLASTVGIQLALTKLVHPAWPWLGAAVGGELLAYAGYTAAYREIARVEGGAELQVPKAAALVAAGFGVFIHGGGFALDSRADPGGLRRGQPAPAGLRRPRHDERPPRHPSAARRPSCGTSGPPAECGTSAHSATR